MGGQHEHEHLDSGHQIRPRCRNVCITLTRNNRLHWTNKSRPVGNILRSSQQSASSLLSTLRRVYAPKSPPPSTTHIHHGRLASIVAILDPLRRYPRGCQARRARIRSGDAASTSHQAAKNRQCKLGSSYACLVHPRRPNTKLSSLKHQLRHLWRCAQYSHDRRRHLHRSRRRLWPWQ